MPIYSSIIPVYKAETYLSACIDSVLAQDTLSTYEIILVDDGSPDGSGAICDAYAAEHPQIRVHHKPNGGVSSARNAGLMLATGEYILFMDADDLWEPELLCAMDAVRTEGPDMTLFPYKEICGNLERPVLPEIFPSGESGAEFLRRILAAGSMPPLAIWGYLYRRAFLSAHSLLFDEKLSLAEDLDFNFRALSTAKRIVAVNQPLYRYFIRSGSLSRQVVGSRMASKLEILVKWCRSYPTSVLANYFAQNCLSISMLPMEDAAALISFAEANQDILDNVSGWRMRLARFLYRSFGFYRGGHIYLRLIDFKHFLLHQAK